MRPENNREPLILRLTAFHVHIPILVADLGQQCLDEAAFLHDGLVRGGRGDLAARRHLCPHHLVELLIELWVLKEREAHNAETAGVERIDEVDRLLRKQ